MLDLTSETPISGVQVRRLTSEDEYQPLDAPKGGQRMANTPDACTGADGRFVLESQRDLAVFRKIHWYSVTLSLTHPAYTRLLTNYTLANVTNSPGGEPVVNAGDIRLTPRAN